MGSCIFCNILEEKGEASMIYKDERCCAFLDLYPANPGHVLVIPVKHAAQMSELDEETGAYMFQIGMRIAEAIRKSELQSDGINFHLADGSAAGQEIFHVHLHIIPRIQGDGFGFKFARGRTPEPQRAALETVAEKIRRAL